MNWSQLPKNIGNMIPMDMINPMPFAQQSMGMVTSTVDKVRDYSNNLKNGVGRAVFGVGNKVLDGGQSIVHGLFNAAEAIPNMVFDLKRNGINAIANMLHIPMDQQSSNSNDSPQQAQQKLPPSNNNFYNPQPSQYMYPYTQGSQQQPQFSGYQPYAGQNLMEGMQPVGPMPFNNPQPMVRYGP